MSTKPKRTFSSCLNLNICYVNIRDTKRENLRKRFRRFTSFVISLFSQVSQASFLSRNGENDETRNFVIRETAKMTKHEISSFAKRRNWQNKSRNRDEKNIWFVESLVWKLIKCQTYDYDNICLESITGCYREIIMWRKGWKKCGEGRNNVTLKEEEFAWKFPFDWLF